MTTCHRDPSGHLQATSPGKFRQSDPNCIEIGLINNMPSAAGKRSVAVAQQARPWPEPPGAGQESRPSRALRLWN